MKQIILQVIDADELCQQLRDVVKEELNKYMFKLKAESPVDIPVKNITAIEFMKAVRICRTKFDKLARGNKIRIIKKQRKIYVPMSEIDRYFNDPTIL